MTKLGNVFIMGDSYSTFEGYIPKGYDIYYFNEAKNSPDVTDVKLTWWHQLCSESGGTILRNCSWSGSTVCHTGYNGTDRSDNSFVSRMEKLIDDGFFKENKTDTYLIFGGTNDSWANSPVGKLMYSDWTKEDLYFVLPAFCYLLKRTKETLPNARIICIINTELKDEISNGFKEACKYYHIEIVSLENIDKVNGHPTALGMKQIKNQIATVI